MRDKIKLLLSSYDRRNWINAIYHHKLGGYSTDDAWLWVLCGLFYPLLDEKYSVEVIDAFFDGYSFDFEFMGIYVHVEYLSSDINGGCIKAIVALNDKCIYNDNYTFHGSLVSNKIIIPDVISIVDEVESYVESLGFGISNGQGFFFSLLKNLLHPLKNKIIVFMGIDENYISPERKQFYRNSLFPIL